MTWSEDGGDAFSSEFDCSVDRLVSCLPMPRDTLVSLILIAIAF